MTDNPTTLNINPDRIDADLKRIAEFTDPDAPYTRRAFSPYYEAARVWLAERFRDAGLVTRVDPAGNLIGRLGEGGGPVLMLGSHTDTVESGGRFDGIVGVLGALEIVRCLRESDVTLSRPLEVVDFLCEEPSVVNLSPLGSRIMAGDVTADMVALATTPDGGRLPDAIARLGGDPSRLDEARRKPGDIYGYLELHIEQGPVLERAGMEVGVVTVVAAPCRAVVTLSGVVDHAGATAMADRRDALAGAAELTLAVERIVSTPDIVQESVGTVGFLRVTPNMVNVIPGRADLTVEVRSTQTEALLWAREEIERALRELADRRGLGATLEWQHLEEPVPVPLHMQDIVAESAESLRLRTLHLPSRASHDAARLAPVAPVGMVFIPCRDGRSHCPEEWAELDAIVTGTQRLGGALLRLDAQS
ncbi:MAG: Zn-dependent hydrolase [Chloroflexi bacterium]|nr:Zn-dependent hydrolase [Chloroflexota bacterium]